MTSVKGTPQGLSSQDLIEKIKTNPNSGVRGPGEAKRPHTQGVTDSVKPDKVFEQNLKNQIDGKTNSASALNTKDADPLKFSAHAKSRLVSRGIELTPDEIVRMQEAIQKAGEKGAKESLILTDKAAFVVSVKNNTVITAVDKDSMKENIFTNIDSTIMI